MTNAYFSNHSSMVINDDNEFNALDHVSPNIDWIYIAPQDMELHYKNADGSVATKSAKKGDIIIQMYSRDFEGSENYQSIIVVSDSEWKNNIEIYDNACKPKNPCCDCETTNTK